MEEDGETTIWNPCMGEGEPHVGKWMTLDGKRDPRASA